MSTSLKHYMDSNCSNIYHSLEALFPHSVASDIINGFGRNHNLLCLRALLQLLAWNGIFNRMYGHSHVMVNGHFLSVNV